MEYAYVMAERTVVSEGDLTEEQRETFKKAWEATGDEAVVTYQGLRWTVDYHPLEREFILIGADEATQ